MHPSVCKQIFGEFECVYTLTFLRFLYKNVVIYKRIRVYTILNSRSFCQLCIACLYLVYDCNLTFQLTLIMTLSKCQMQHTDIIAIYISTGENIACIIGIYRGFHFMGEIETFWIIFQPERKRGAKKLSKKSRFPP